MVSGSTFEVLRGGLILYIVFVGSLCVREYVRARVLDWLGDPNPAAQGRLTLHPLAHMDVFGSVVFPLLCIFLFSGMLPFGWGKPLFPNPSYFEKPRRGEVIAALSGPLANLLLALSAAVLLGLLCRVSPALEVLFAPFLYINVLLAVFNLIPLPPFDGGVLLKVMIRMSEETFLRLSQWSFLIWLLIFSFPPLKKLLIYCVMFLAAPLELLFNLIYQK